MPRSLSETGKAVGLAIYELGQKGEKFVPATLTNQIDDLSPQNCSNRLKHFRDLGFIVKGFDGLYSVPEDKVEPLWNYLSSTGAVVKKKHAKLSDVHEEVELPDTYVVAVNNRYDLWKMYVVACHLGGPYREVFDKFLRHHMNVLYTFIAISLQVDDTTTSEPWYNTTKDQLESMMQ